MHFQFTYKLDLNYICSGGRGSKFRWSVIRYLPVPHYFRMAQSVSRHRYFNSASVIAKLQFGSVGNFCRSVIRKRRPASLSSSLSHHYFNCGSVIAILWFVTGIL